MGGATRSGESTFASALAGFWRHPFGGGNATEGSDGLHGTGEIRGQCNNGTTATECPTCFARSIKWNVSVKSTAVSEQHLA